MNKKILAFPYIIWMIGFTVIPLAMVFYYGFTAADGTFTLENIIAILIPERYGALFRSLKLSIINTCICLVLAYPLAMILKNRQMGKQSFIVFLFILPMWMNFLLRTMAWQVLLEKNGVLNSILSFLGLPPLRLINTEGAIVFGMVYNYLPFMVLPIYNGLTKIGTDVTEAAADLGANKIQVFFRVIFPLSLPGVISGITMVFVPSLTTFVISDLLGGGKVLLIGNVIEQEFTFAADWHLGSGMSLILMLFIFLSMAITAKYDKEGAGTTF